MRFLYIANIRLPTERAHGIQIMENCRVFSECPNAAVTLLIARRFGFQRQDIFAYYELRPTFSIKRLWCFDLLVLPFWKKLFFIFEAASFTLAALAYAWWSRKNHDLIYTRDFYVAAALSFIKPVFYEVHSLPSRPTRWHFLSWRRATGLITISDNLKTDLIKLGLPSDKILVARDGVNIKRFAISLDKEQARLALTLPLKRRIVVHTGHLYAWKGADLLAQAALNLAGDVHVYFVGGTNEDVDKWRGRYRADNIHIIGHRPQTEIPLWLKAADFLVIANSAEERISSHYTSPLKLFEYLASGTPIIASNLPSIREVLGEDEAVFFTPDSVSDLRQKITDSFRHQESLTLRARLAQSKVEQYDWANRGRLIFDFILAYLAKMELNE